MAEESGESDKPIRKPILSPPGEAPNYGYVEIIKGGYVEQLNTPVRSCKREKDKN
jgi:hypothetical protein